MTDRLGLSKSGNTNNGDMNMSDKNIYQRLVAVMSAVSYVQKEDRKVNNQYTFVSHDAVTAKIRPALLAEGVATVCSVKNHIQDGNRTEVTLAVRFVNIDKPEDFVEVESFGYGIDPQDKGPGKAVSYAFKYALLKTFCLETGDDPERDSIEHAPATKSAPKAQAKPAYNMQDAEKSLRMQKTLDSLKAVFGRMWQEAPAEFRPSLQAVYNDCKDVLTQMQKEVA